ncbi:hypothetical protein ES703_00130 [subsurface metagenome]
MGSDQLSLLTEWEKEQKQLKKEEEEAARKKEEQPALFDF